MTNVCLHILSVNVYVRYLPLCVIMKEKSGLKESVECLFTCLVLWNKAKEIPNEFEMKGW